MSQKPVSHKDDPDAATALEEARARVEELERENAELRRRDQLRDEFINNISHELRTSLSAVKNVISNALDGVAGELSDRLRRSLLLADDNIRHFTQIINDLLDVARLESGRMALHRSPTDPMRVVTGLATSHEEEAAKRGIELRTDWTVPPMSVFMDGSRISQIIGNLIGNAVKFTPWGGTITVRGYLCSAMGLPLEGEELSRMPEGAQFAVSVSDTGPGIDAKRIEKIFDRYEQAGTVVHRPGEEGLGLGLTICRHLVALHGGRIWAENIPAGGARLTFTIPFLSRGEMFHEALADRVRTALIHRYALALILLEATPEQTTAAHGEFPEALAVQVEAVIRQVLRRKADTLLWLGSSSFAVILPQTSREDGRVVLDRLLEAALQAEPRIGTKRVRLRTRGAIVGLPENGESPEELTAAAEKQLSLATHVRSAAPPRARENQVVAPAVSPTAMAGPAHEGTQARRKIVLVVGGEEGFVTVLRELLAFHGFEVMNAPDGPSGLELARRKMPDLILLEAAMPAMDGGMFCRLLKFDEKYRGIPIIMLMAQRIEGDLAVGALSGADDDITKPVDLDLLLKKIHHQLARRAEAEDLSSS